MTKNESREFSIRGGVFVGTVKSAKAPKTVTVERTLTTFVPKYERYKKVRSTVHAHVPEGMVVTEGDVIKIGETRKISKTKNFMVIEVVQKGDAVDKQRVLDEVEKQETMHEKAKRKEKDGEEK